jgi:hypothetical protein
MLLGGIRNRALEKLQDHHLRNATEAPSAAARNAQPPVNSQASSPSLYSPINENSWDVGVLSKAPVSNARGLGAGAEDLGQGEAAEGERSGGEEQAPAAARQSSRQEQKAKREASRALLPTLDARPETKRLTDEAHDRIMEVQHVADTLRLRSNENEKRQPSGSPMSESASFSLKHRKNSKRSSAPQMLSGLYFIGTMSNLSGRVCSIGRTIGCACAHCRIVCQCAWKYLPFTAADEGPPLIPCFRFFNFRLWGVYS